MLYERHCNGGNTREGCSKGADVWRCPVCGMTYTVRGSPYCPCGDVSGEAVELVEVEQERVVNCGQKWEEEGRL